MATAARTRTPTWPADLSATECRLVDHLTAFGPTSTKDLATVLGTSNVSAIALRLNPKLERAGLPQRLECIGTLQAGDQFHAHRRVGIWAIVGIEA